MQNRAKTGDIVTSPGVYKNKYGKKIVLTANAVFPPCPVQNKEIFWEKEEE